MKKSAAFPHPIGLMLFNRIEYARKVLESLKAQTVPVDQSKLYISIDGYVGSKPEFQGKPDNTSAIEEMARSLFSNATIRRLQNNIGFTESKSFIEESMLTSHPDATWLGFFEEDYALGSDYLSIAEQLVSAAQPLDDVVVVAATGETLDPDHRDVEGIFPIGHLWAYFVRASHVHERQDEIRVYRRQLSRKSYWERDKIALARVMASRGVFPAGIGDDHMRLGLMFRFNRVGITTGLSYGEHIGIEGEHMTEKSFARFNFTRPTTVPFDISAVDLPALVPTLRAQFHAGFAKRLAERFVIPKMQAFSAQKSFESLSRWRRAISLIRQAFRTPL